jgi:hypothetical protein
MWGCSAMRRAVRWLVVVVALLAMFATTGCQPSVTGQLEAALPKTSARPTTMPDVVGRDADAVATELLNAHVNVRVSVPARSVPAGRTQKGGHIRAVTLLPVTVDLTPSNGRFVGFKVISQEPAAGASLAASQTVVLVVGLHPKTQPGATWYSTHRLEVKRNGDTSCYDATSGGQAGCHARSFCDACHVKTVTP